MRSVDLSNFCAATFDRSGTLILPLVSFSDSDPVNPDFREHVFDGNTGQFLEYSA
jgi:hypothetical protein